MILSRFGGTTWRREQERGTAIKKDREIERERDREREGEGESVRKGKGWNHSQRGMNVECENQISTKFAQNHYYYGRSLQTMRSGFQILIL